MPKRVGLPGRSELFRDTNLQPSGKRATGRVNHDEKITVYLSTEELMALEQARVHLRGEYGLKVDRGRLVRAAIAEALADLEANHDESELVIRLRQA